MILKVIKDFEGLSKNSLAKVASCYKINENGNNFANNLIRCSFDECDVIALYDKQMLYPKDIFQIATTKVFNGELPSNKDFVISSIFSMGTDGKEYEILEGFVDIASISCIEVESNGEYYQIPIQYTEISIYTKDEIEKYRKTVEYIDREEYKEDWLAEWDEDEKIEFTSEIKKKYFIHNEGTPSIEAGTKYEIIEFGKRSNGVFIPCEQELARIAKIRVNGRTIVVLLSNGAVVTE